MFNASELLQLLLLADDKNVFIVITSIIILLALSIKSNMLWKIAWKQQVITKFIENKIALTNIKLFLFYYFILS